MTIFIKGHTFGYEMQRVAQMFFPGERVAVSEDEPSGDSYILASADGDLLSAEISVDGKVARAQRTADTSDDKNTREHKLGILVYKLASEATGIHPQWGVLTGIRPVKLFVSRIEAGMDETELRAHFVERRLVSPEKFDLAMKTAYAEREILSRSTPDSFSLYVSIPFCPTRCAYCSFVSHSVERAARLIPDYVDKLCDELAHTAKIAARLRLKLRTVYFGGGTPTTLSAQQLKRVTDTIAAHFDIANVWEYTVEAGRPDTVTADKLRVIREAGANRISINPQTLSDSVLEVIGRKHTTQQLRKAFAIARDCGCDNINMDLIAGLPTDTPERFRASIDGVLAMNPENVTVHTLTVKRSAEMTFERARNELALVGDMVGYAQSAITSAGYNPYYLYRQNGTLSSLENVGYAKPGTEGLYNVYIMDETHSIFAVGAGASTKLRHPVTGEIERVYNYKYPYEYMERFDAAKNRKDRILEFYEK